VVWLCCGSRRYNLIYKIIATGTSMPLSREVMVSPFGSSQASTDIRSLRRGMKRGPYSNTFQNWTRHHGNVGGISTRSFLSQRNQAHLVDQRVVWQPFNKLLRTVSCWIWGIVDLSLHGVTVENELT
jgi:hypothetical protein